MKEDGVYLKNYYMTANHYTVQYLSAMISMNSLFTVLLSVTERKDYIANFFGL